jgi:hypothetical protein
MVEPGKGSRGPKSTSLTTPEAFPTTAPQLPSGDYSYTVELVGSIQHQLGKLTEAVETLKTKAESHSKELRDIGKDVHTAKVVMGIVGGIVTIIATFLGIALKAYLDHLWRTPAK